MCYRSSSIPFILLALSLLAVSCGSRSGHTGQMPPMEIEIAVAEFDLLYTRRSFISQINSDNEVVVEPRVSGFLVARHYKKGMPVRKGQLIFEIDDSEYYTALLSAQAALESSRALALEAKNNFDRAVPLAKINAISGTQLDQYTAQYAASEADVKSARQALRNAQLNLGYTKIYAQIDGIIESSNGSVGDYVGPGTQIPTLTTIMNIDTVQVPIAIPMTQFLRLDSNRTNIYDNAELLSEIVLYEADGTCTAPQKLDTFGVFFMKYNYEIRLKAVKLVLEGGLSVREAGCHLGCGRSQVHLWVTLFERHGLAGLKLRHGSYSAEFKLSVLKHMHQNHLSLLETAVHFGIPGPFVIRQWERLYQNQGAEGLRRKPQRRRPAMSKSKTKKVKLKTTPHEELLKELEYLRAENAYLKKLQALVEERIVRESGKEPKPSKD